MDLFDAIVIGSGPAGGTAGLLLAQAGWSVAIVEAKPFPRRKVCGEYLSATNWPLLARLGIEEAFYDLAGPPVQRTAIIEGNKIAEADLPRPKTGCWGQAMSRAHLDTLLIERARRCDAKIFQPYRCTGLEKRGDRWDCRLTSHEGTIDIQAKVAIAAHGSWEIGSLPTQRHRVPPRSSDWLAFKTHLQDCSLPLGQMPLISFPDGYSGMVHYAPDRVSLSFCIRRSRLESLQWNKEHPAGEAILQFVLDTTPAIRPWLENARHDGPWLSAGPIQPGYRACYRDGVFVCGNAAGEAHPAAAEGISIAMQSGWLLAERLIKHKQDLPSNAGCSQIAADYSRAFKRSFASRLYATTAIAHWISRPALVRATLPALRSFPDLLTFGAKLTGKSRVVVQPQTPSLIG